MFLIGAAARWAGYLCVFILAGLVVCRQLVRQSSAGPARPLLAAFEEQAARWGMLLGLALAAFDLVRLWVQIRAFFAPEPTTLDLAGIIVNGTAWGSGWKVQAIAAAAAGVCFAAAARRWPGAWTLAGAAAVVVAVSRPLTGHALEQGSWLALPVILQAVHVLAAAAWLGTLFAILVPLRRSAAVLPGPHRGVAIAAVVHAFSPLALGAAMALFIAGAATSFMYLDGPMSLVTTAWGRVLLAKVGAFATVVALGYFNWQKVRPRLLVAGPVDAAAGVADGGAGEALLMRFAGLELAVAALVLALTAALVALPMPAG